MKLLKKMMVILILISMTSCMNKEENEISDYLSFTLTYENSSSDDTSLSSDIYTIDLASDELTIRATIPFEQDFPVGIYDVYTDSIFYSGASPFVEGNQLFQKNLKTNEVKQLTDDFAYISGLNIIDEERVLISGVKKNADDIAVHLFMFNHINAKTIEIYQNNDFDVRSVLVDFDNSRIIFSGRSISMLRERMNDQIDGEEYKSGDAFILEYKKGMLTQLEVVSGKEIIDIIFVDNKLIYLDDDYKIGCINTLDHSLCKIDYNFHRFPIYDVKSNSVYYVEGNKIISESSFNDKTNIFESPYDKSAINNMMVVRKNKGSFN